MLKRPQAQEMRGSVLSATQSQAEKQQPQLVDKMKLDRMLRKPRSKKYMEAVCGLDSGGHVNNHAKANEIIDAIRSEFPDVEISGIMLGIVSVCYLGKPYEVHSLDITGNVIEHYKESEPLQGGLEKARSIALRGGYEFIEVYVDCCRAISDGGDVSVIPC